MVDSLSRMGQSLFAPPNVKGWRTGTDWLNSATLLARNNFAEKVAVGEWNRTPRPRRNEVFMTEGRPPTPDDLKVGDTASAQQPDAKYDICTAIYAAKPKDTSMLRTLTQHRTSLRCR